MASVATIESAAGIAKRVHGDISRLLPNGDLKFTKRVKFDEKRKTGGSFAEAIWLTHEHGFTAGGTSGAARTLGDAVVAQSKLAEFTPSSFHFRTRIVHELLSAAESKGPRAFERLIQGTMLNCRRAVSKRNEQRQLYGGRPLATLASATDAVTTTVMTIATAKWAPGPWIGGRNMELDAYNGDTQLNTDGAMTVTVVNPKTREITATGTAADVDRIVAAGASCDLYYRGYKGNDGLGLRRVAGLTSSSGSYLGIACGDFADVWCATQITWNHATTEFSWGLLNEGLEEAYGRGLEGDVIALVSLEAWRDLNSSLEALRVLDSSYSPKKGEMGQEVDSIVYHSITGGKVTVEPSTFVHRGDVICYADPADADNDVAIIGSTDATFEVPSMGEQIMVQVPGTNYVELGMFEQNGLWLPAPAKCVLFSA